MTSQYLKHSKNWPNINKQNLAPSPIPLVKKIQLKPVQLVSTGPINLDLVTPMLSMGLWPGIQFQKLHSSTPKVLLLVSISTNPPHMYGLAYIVELYSGLPSLAYELFDSNATALLHCVSRDDCTSKLLLYLRTS